MRDRQTCIGCGKKSPETETNYTLISAQFGWRLTRYRNPDGTIVIEWRCPTCWRDYKKTKGGDPGSPGSEPISAPMQASANVSPNGRPSSSKPMQAHEKTSSIPPETPRSPIVAPPPKRR